MFYHTCSCSLFCFFGGGIVPSSLIVLRSLGMCFQVMKVRWVGSGSFWYWCLWWGGRGWEGKGGGAVHGKRPIFLNSSTVNYCAAFLRQYKTKQGKTVGGQAPVMRKYIPVLCSYSALHHKQNRQNGMYDTYIDSSARGSLVAYAMYHTSTAMSHSGQSKLKKEGEK